MIIPSKSRSLNCFAISSVASLLTVNTVFSRFSFPIYFPELQTDFIYGVFSSNYGLIGSILLIILFIYFDINLINSASKTYDNKDKYTIAGIVSMLVFQQIWSLSMTIGLLPIMGITLPFISYGGSSLLSYMFLVGIIFNVSNQSLRYTN